MIKAERPLALIVIGNLPMLPAPKAHGELRACPQRGKKRESSGESGRKQGSAVGRARNPLPSVREIVLESGRGVSRTERCYEPARAHLVVAIPGRDAAIPMPPGLDHDLVIRAF
jgi:hypothetical protein